MKEIDTLISVPPATAAHLATARPPWLYKSLQAGPHGQVHVTCDPPGSRLGSGGGTIHLLHHFKQAQGQCAMPLAEWLTERQRLIVHAGGQSRRLPAYAAIGKLFMPIPTLPSLRHQHYNQILADFQIPPYSQALRESGQQPAIMISSGDVMLDFNPLDVPLVQADIVGLGMQVSPAVAQHFGIFFVERRSMGRGQPEKRIDFFLQKPSVDEIQEHLGTHEFYVDSGMWLLSARAVEVLFRYCGWNEEKGAFKTPDGLPRFLDLYTEVGTALGLGELPPALAAAGFGELTRSVVPLPGARFYHLGSSKQIFSFLDDVQQLGEERESLYRMGSPIVLSAGSATPVWAESAAVQEIHAGGKNLLTGLPAGNSVSQLGRCWCIDATPVGQTLHAWRPYHVQDLFRGAANSPDSTICGQPARAWLEARGLPVSTTDVFQLPLYPLLAAEAMTQELLDWYFSPEPDPALSRRFVDWRRLSGQQIGEEANVGRILSTRLEGQRASVRAAFTAPDGRLPEGWLQQDFAALARFIHDELPEVKRELSATPGRLSEHVHQARLRARLLMFLAELSDDKGEAQALQESAFAALRAAIVKGSEASRVIPQLDLKRDQIVWARSPVRLDLGGGWTDTPPYCMETGGSVVNVGVMLNGQPPIQVIVRVLDEPEFRLRSMDQGSEEIVRTYEELAEFRTAGSAFSLPKAALYLTGFHPDFFDGSPYPSLRAQLEDFGGGLELSLLCAVPKGSGLGTSSILAATLLGATGRACKLNLDKVDLYHRVLAMEQLLTTGGGWQDQAGAIFRGLKQISTSAGPAQHPTVHNLPEYIFSGARAQQRYLLYYTGLTRMAKNILQQIVRNMFLGDRQTFFTLDLIGRNARQIYQAILTSNEEEMLRGIARSWTLNKRLDPDTSTPAIESILALCGDDLAASKLLGAGGGGYMLICARSAEAGERIRQRLTANPPNALARFVEFTVAESGMQVTVS